jgi:hypothetical protein
MSVGMPSNVVSSLSIKSNVGRKEAKELDAKREIIAYKRTYPKSKLITYV